MQRKSYTKEFIIRAVQLMRESSKPIRQLAEELGVVENNFYNWRKQLLEKADNAFSNQPPLDEKEFGDPETSSHQIHFHNSTLPS